jgi:hypothetical protein
LEGIDMRERTPLKGRYIRLDEPFLREKANRNDHRNVFYKATLANDTYEAYSAQVRGIEVSVETYRTSPINGRMEILYARRRGWIVDA